VEWYEEYRSVCELKKNHARDSQNRGLSLIEVHTGVILENDSLVFDEGEDFIGGKDVDAFGLPVEPHASLEMKLVYKVEERVDE